MSVSFTSLSILLQVVTLLFIVAVASADHAVGRSRAGRQFNDDGGNDIGGLAIDFSNAVFDEETGKRCVIKEEEVQSLEKEPILECTHKSVEKCHYTYVTQFKPSQEEVCEENFEKVCQITFKQVPQEETVKKCYKPLQSVCNGQGKDICKTVYESACTTRYVEKQPGKFVGDTNCERQPIEICGAGCVVEEGPEECHDKTITSLIDVPEEICDLNPQKTCRLATKLVPSLVPKHECTVIPQEVCNLKFTAPKLVKKPLMTKWCLDESEPTPGETYDEEAALDAPVDLRTPLGSENIPVYVPANNNDDAFGTPFRPFQQAQYGDRINNNNGRKRRV